MKKKIKRCVVEVYARVTGFMRPVQNWNPGKKVEQKDRKMYDLKGDKNEQKRRIKTSN